MQINITVPTRLSALNKEQSFQKTTSVIEDITDFDVICAQDRSNAHRAGNTIYNNLIDETIPKYRNAKTKQEKMNLTRNVVRTMQSKYSARFVRRNKDGDWEKLTDQMARDKVSHALRFACKQSKKKRTVVSPISVRHVRQVTEESPEPPQLDSIGDMLANCLEDEIIMWEPLITPRSESLLLPEEAPSSSMFNSLMLSDLDFESFGLIECFEE